ncbi:hypothetical protein STIAU_4620 [Stigmatella aurantiaca DW4/3-1]|uniref:Uncharacterized protein n=1 Tax=Stigmatella aurantiaca (strain DW4/3-1) TaxID=378806 RepID=Q093S2_STIAD|nr:hypothetical protein STIAU_4620 [Stigmatella aurantiaca DW4/3-1]
MGAAPPEGAPAAENGARRVGRAAPLRSAPACHTPPGAVGGHPGHRARGFAPGLRSRLAGGTPPCPAPSRRWLESAPRAAGARAGASTPRGRSSLHGLADGDHGTKVAIEFIAAECRQIHARHHPIQVQRILAAKLVAEEARELMKVHCLLGHGEDHPGRGDDSHAAAARREVPAAFTECGMHLAVQEQGGPRLGGIQHLRGGVSRIGRALQNARPRFRDEEDGVGLEEEVAGLLLGIEAHELASVFHVQPHGPPGRGEHPGIGGEHEAFSPALEPASQVAQAAERRPIRLLEVKAQLGLGEVDLVRVVGIPPVGNAACRHPASGSLKGAGRRRRVGRGEQVGGAGAQPRADQQCDQVLHRDRPSGGAAWAHGLMPWGLLDGTERVLGMTAKVGGFGVPHRSNMARDSPERAPPRAHPSRGSQRCPAAAVRSNARLQVKVRAGSQSNPRPRVRSPRARCQSAEVNCRTAMSSP